MGTVYDDVTDVREWLQLERMFFVGTAPCGADGHVNISPKGDMRTFRVLGPARVAYLDLFGSEIETVAHLRDNGRIVLMFCAFEGGPRVVRLHGRGRVVEQGDAEWDSLLREFDPPDEVRAASRAIVHVDVTRVADSCGFVVPEMTHVKDGDSVPEMNYVKERKQLYAYAEVAVRKHGPDAIQSYCDTNNAVSIDGLPALRPRGEALTPEQRRIYDATGRKL